jgi:anti-sigma factor RsiW
MKCSDSVILIARKLDGMLTDSDAKTLEAHLARCARCRRELMLQQKLVQTLKQDLPGMVSADFTRRVTDRARRLDGETRRLRIRLGDLLPALPAVAGCLLLVLFWKDLADIVAPAMEVVADATGGPLAALGDGLAKVLDRLAPAPHVSLPGRAVISQLLANIYVGAAIACAATVWAFTRAYAFIRH